MSVYISGQQIIAPLPVPAPAPIIFPTAYWVSRGFDEATAYGIERFQCQLQDRKFVYSHVVYLGPATSDVQSIPHHDMLLPHWKHYVKNLVERARAKAFFVEKFQLDRSSVLDIIIVPTLLTMQLSELGLCECSIDRDGLLLVSKYLSQNRSLKRLLLNDNQIEDVEVARALSLSVRQHPALEELCISRCGLGSNDGDHVLPEILAGCDLLKILRISGNNIDSAGVAHVGKFLAGDPCLTSLRLDRNLLSDADAAPIAAALRTNTTLKYLYLKGNNGFTDTGKMEMTTTVVLDGKSLNSIADSNHECEIVYSAPVVARTIHINEKYWTVKRKIESKVVLALYGMDSDTPAVNYFNDVPLKLIPHGLELIQKKLDCLEQQDSVYFCVENEPRQLLSRIFCFVRDWNLPWLFDNGG